MGVDTTGGQDAKIVLRRMLSWVGSDDCSTSNIASRPNASYFGIPLRFNMWGSFAEPIGTPRFPSAKIDRI